MTQSVELLLDPVAEAAVREEWLRLHEAGQPTELRVNGHPSHRPHLTLYAGDAIEASAEAALAELVPGLDLTLELGALTLFGPHRDRYVLVHAVVPTLALLQLQQQVAVACGADPAGHFGPGRWTPHVTVARRLLSERVPGVLQTLAASGVVGHRVSVTQCRRWDGTAKVSWLL